MTKSNGIKSLKQAAKLLNKHSPDGESLAYINPEEAKLLKSHGGSGIMTVAGVPSYNILTDAWDWVTEKAEPIVEWLGYGDDEGSGRLLKDLSSLGGGYLGYKEAKELSDWEKEQYAKQQQKELVNQIRFASESDSGKQLLTPTNVPETIEDVSVFSEATGIPDMKTTAAHGGRIGYDNGGISTMMAGSVSQDDMLNDLSWEKFNKPVKELTPLELKEFWEEVQRLNTKVAHGGRIGYKDAGDVEIPEQFLEDLKRRDFQKLLDEYYRWQDFQERKKDFGPGGQNVAQGGRIGYNFGGIDRPFQGIGALNRMGYQNAGEVENFNWGGPDMIEWASAREKGMDKDPLFASRIMKLEGEHERDVAEHEGAALFDKAWDLVNRGIAENINHALQMLRGEIEPQLPIGAAQGGRIGYAGGSDPLVDAAWEEWLALPDDLKGNYIGFEDFLNERQGEWWNLPGKAQGGRIGAQSGGIMPLLNMGGMEKDYRQDGGFVPIGRKEKADDVPARLSKNEFVFTADAVRAAGGGDIDQGAQRMYNVMKNLEAGGEISEQSQGKA